MTRIARQRGAHHRMDFGLRLEPFGDLKRGGAMLCETGMECPQTADRHIGVVGRYRPAGLIARRREQFGGMALRRGETPEHVRMADDSFGERLDAHRSEERTSAT